MIKRIGRAFLFAIGGMSATLSVVFAQDVPERFPAEGLPILDCAPLPPAPRDSCTLRIPLGHQRSALNSQPVGDANVEFEFLAAQNAGFPSDVVSSATLLLIDTTPGQNQGRRAFFNRERQLLSAFAAGLPQNELVAVYGFHENLEQIVPFTTDRSTVRTSIEQLQLSGTNTLIASTLMEASDVLAARSDVLFKNIILISDGENEGAIDAIKVREELDKKGISLSAVGTYWRPIGAAQIGEGKGLLNALTTGGLGAAAHAELRNQAESTVAIEGLAADLRAAATASGLIVATQSDGLADITVTLKEPVPGQSGSFQDRDISVRFTPAGYQPATDPDEEPSQDGMIFGYPAWYTYLGAGLLAALIVLVALVVLGRQQTDDSDIEDADDMELDLDAPDAPATTTAMPTPSSEPALAYLVVEGSQTRFPVTRDRIAIGRGASNTIKLGDDSISRVHAELHPNRDGGFSLTDMQSLNGTFVNRERVKGTRTVKPGDTLTFGEVKTKLVPA